jgi:hypothetical protein
MRQFRTYGSVRGAARKGRPYRDSLFRPQSIPRREDDGRKRLPTPSLARSYFPRSSSSRRVRFSPRALSETTLPLWSTRIAVGTLCTP